MKIIHCCLSNFYIDNYSYQENLITKYHHLQGHEVLVIASRFSFNDKGQGILLPAGPEYKSDDGFRIKRIDYKTPFLKFNKFIRHYKGFYKILIEEKPDIIFVHNFQFFDVLKIKKYKKRHSNTKVFVDNHADYVNSASNWLSKNILHRIIYKFYAKKITPYVEKFYGVLPIRCTFLNDIYKIPDSKISYLEMGIDDYRVNNKDKDTIRNNIRNKLNIDKNDFVIISGGKIDTNKNFHLLIEAIDKIKIDNIKLILFGNIHPNFKESFSKYLKSDKVKYIGWIDSKEINDYLLASDLAVMPGTHSVIWEQIVGCGIPAIFKHYDGMHHIDIGGNCLFLYKNTSEEIKEALMKVISNPQTYQKMLSASNSPIKKKFYYSEIARKSIT